MSDSLRVVAFFVGIVAVGVLVLMPATWLLTSLGFSLYPPLDRSWFVTRGAVASLPVYAALLKPGVRRWFRGLAGSRDREQAAGGLVAFLARAALRFMLVFAFVLAPFVLANLLAFANGAFDRGVEARHDTFVLDKHRSGGGRAAIRYTLKLQSWRGDASFYDLAADESTFERAKVLAPLRVGTRPGRLGQEWVSGYGLR